MRCGLSLARNLGIGLLLGLALTGCPTPSDSGSGPTTPGGGTTTARVASVELSPTTSTLDLARTQQLTATVRDTRGQLVTNPVLIWTTSSSIVATVTSAGIVTAVAEGTATISATSPDGPSGTAVVTVRGRVASVTVSPTTADLLAGGPGTQLTATVKAADGRTLTDRTVAWSTSSAAVATVSGTGLVTAVGAGTATITATVESVTGTATVTTIVDPCQVIRALAVGQSATGTLTATDCRLSDNTAFQKHQFTLTSLTTVEIQMSSTQVDPYLLVVNSANIVVDEDDDGGGGTSARILRELPPGRYTIYANTFAEKEYGAYTLTLREAPAPCTTARPVALPTTTVTTTLSATTSCRRNDGSYEDRYSLTVTSRTTVSLGMSSSAIDPVLTVLDSKQKVWGQDDDSGTGLDAALEVPLEPGTYTIFARGYPGETGAYRLDVRTVTDPCAITRVIAVGGSASGSLTRTDCPLRDGTAGGATYFSHRYRLTMGAAGRVQIDLNSSGFDTYLIVQNATTAAVVGENDDVSDASTNSRLTLSLPAGEYVVNVTSYEPETVGAYTLAVTSAAATAVAVAVAPGTATLQPGQTQRITATVTGSPNTRVAWSSSAPAVASVDTTGLVRALTAGSAIILATSNADQTRSASMTVTVTATTATTNLDIAALYLVQVTQQLDGRVPLVAGRDAVARVFVRGSRAGLAAATVRLRLYEGSTLLETFTGTATPSTTVDESCCSANITIPAARIRAGVSILADVDPTNTVAETNETDNSFPLDGRARVLTVRTAPAFNLRFLSIVQNRNGFRGTVTSGMANQLRAFWPLGTVNATQRTAPLTIDYVLDASRPEDFVRLVRDVETARRADNFSGYYYGLFTYRSTSGILGIANGIPARSAIGIDESTPFGALEGQLTFVHEMGHTFGLRHAPCGGAAGPEPSFPFSDGRTGNWGMNTTVSPAVLMPPARTDVMGYCENQWVGAFNYRRVMDFREVNPNGTGLRAETATLLVNGGVSSGRVELDAALSLTTDPDQEDPEGRFLLEGFDATGRRLFAHRFSPYRVDDGADAREAFVIGVPLAEKLQAQLVRLAVREFTGTRTASKVKPADAATLMDGVQAAALADGGLRVDWPAGVRPVTYIRDRVSRQIIGVSREGSLQLAGTVPLAQVELLVSNGVTSTTYTIDPVTRQVRR